MNASENVHKKVAKFKNRTRDLVWETWPREGR